MKRRVLIRGSALFDLEEQAVFLDQRSVDLGPRFAGACLSEFDGLADMPGRGRAREFKNPRFQDVRSWTVKGFPNYLIFYRDLGDAIEILRVLHGARDIDSIFEEKV